MAAPLIGIRFREAAKLYHFAPPQSGLEVHTGEHVIVETARGLEMGRVVTVPAADATDEIPSDVRPIVRLATRDDQDRAREMRERGNAILETLRREAVEQGLDMLVVAVQMNLAGNEATVFFQADEHIDFRALTSRVESEFDVRVHMQLAGARDRAKIVDGYDICGLRLCCSSWMTSFPKVGIRMAKDQDLSLNPDKISGVCGRLLCCLTFEFPVYREMRGTLPKVGKRVSTPVGMGKVIKLDVLQQQVTIYLEDQNQRVQVPAHEIGMAVRVEEAPNQALKEAEEQARRPAAAVPTAEPAQRAEESEAAEGEGRRRRRRRRRRSGGGEGGQPSTAPVGEERGDAPRDPHADEPGSGTSGRRRRRRRPRSDRPDGDGLGGTSGDSG